MKKTILFVVTNGAGLGHLTRGLAIAKRIRKMEPESEIIFLSTSLATEVIRNEGFMYYYIPTKSIMPENVNASMWNNYMKAHLDSIVSFHKPDILVFDGGYPYGGVIATLKAYKNIKGVWVKREEYKDNISDLGMKENEFHKVITPLETGIINKRLDEGIEKKEYCNPIIMIEDNEMYEREALRKAWGVTANENIFYMQLGAGAINRIDSDLRIAIECVLENPNNRVILGESIIGSHIQLNYDRVSIIRQYPNAIYFKGIDYAISAAGYNSVQELVNFQVPTLFIPNKNTQRDDQVARAMQVQNIGAGVCVADVTKETIKTALEYMYTHRLQMVEQAKSVKKQNGAEEAAKIIIELI